MCELIGIKMNRKISFQLLQILETKERQEIISCVTMQTRAMTVGMMGRLVILFGLKEWTQILLHQNKNKRTNI